jgi:hypothetical protein
MQYRFGYFTMATATTQTAVIPRTLELGFIPSKFQMVNYSTWTTATAVTSNVWYSGMPSASALQMTNANSVVTPISITTFGITPFSDGAEWSPEQATITGVTKALPAVVTATNTFSNGDIITISGVAGMTQLNTNRYMVVNASGSAFSLYDLFGNPVDSTAYGTYVAAAAGFPGGYANRISTPPTAPSLNALTGQVITPGGPPGNFYDTGSAGLTLGRNLFNITADTWYWEASYQTPTGY